MDPGLVWHNDHKVVTIECWWKWENTSNSGLLWRLTDTASSPTVDFEF